MAVVAEGTSRTQFHLFDGHRQILVTNCRSQETRANDFCDKRFVVIFWQFRIWRGNVAKPSPKRAYEDK